MSDGRSATEPDAGDEEEPEPPPRGPASDEPSEAEGPESQVAAVLGSPEFQAAACRVAGVALAAQGATALSCQDFVDGCLNTVGALDASAVGLTLVDESIELEDCDVTTTQVDACLAEFAKAVVDLSEDTSCASDAGALPSLGPELLLSAPSCLPVVLRCPALLDLLGTLMPM